MNKILGLFTIASVALIISCGTKPQNNDSTEQINAQKNGEVGVNPEADQIIEKMKAIDYQTIYKNNCAIFALEADKCTDKLDDCLKGVSLINNKAYQQIDKDQKKIIEFFTKEKINLEDIVFCSNKLPELNNLMGTLNCQSTKNEQENIKKQTQDIIAKDPAKAETCSKVLLGISMFATIDYNPSSTR